MGEMTAGILLGPSLFGRVAPVAFGYLFPATGLGGLSALSQVGLILFLFLVGMQVRPHDKSGIAGLAIAASSASMLVPLVLGGLLALPLHRELVSDVSLPTFALFMAVAMSITALPVLARILTERGMLNTRAGAIAISCAAVDDVVAWCFVALLLAASTAEWLWVLAGLVGYGALMLYGARPLLRRFSPELPTALLVLLASAWVTEALGVQALFGAFVAGLGNAARHGIAEGRRANHQHFTAAIVLRVHRSTDEHRAAFSGAKLWLLLRGDNRCRDFGKAAGVRIHSQVPRAWVAGSSDSGYSGQHPRLGRVGRPKHRARS